MLTLTARTSSRTIDIGTLVVPVGRMGFVLVPVELTVGLACC